MTPNRGLLVTVEGVEGSGKTTVCRLLAERLREMGLDVETTFDPGGNEVSRRIRDVALCAGEHVSARAELLLFAAARAQNVETVIVPALEPGAVVLSDRFSDSSVAYQGYGRGLLLDEVRRVDEFARGGLIPSLTLLLDLPVEVGLARQVGRDRISAERAEFHERVRAGFLEIARSDPARVKVIDATAGLDDVLTRCLGAIDDILADTRTTSCRT